MCGPARPRSFLAHAGGCHSYRHLKTSSGPKPILDTARRVRAVWSCEGRELNPHAFWTPEPKSGASANSATFARAVLSLVGQTVARARACQRLCSHHEDHSTLARRVARGP